MSADDGPPFSEESTGDPNADDGLLTRLRTADDGPLLFVREVLTSVAAVLLIGLLLFAISGVWPPMVAVESGSMEPHMQKGDLIFITGPQRYAPDAAVEGTSVVTAENGATANYRTFGEYGNVVVYDNPNVAGPPIIHRAMLYVHSGEDWYGRANPDYTTADNCEELAYCPAPYDGFITKGDNNPRYDQVSGISAPVRPAWIDGVARVRIPFLGWVRLTLAGSLSTTTPVGGPAPASTHAPSPSAPSARAPAASIRSPATATFDASVSPPAPGGASVSPAAAPAV